MKKHLEWIEKKVQELDGTDDKVPLLLEITNAVDVMNSDQIKDLIMYLCGELNRARN